MNADVMRGAGRRRWPLSLPLRWRLALFYGALAALVLLLLGFVLYRQIDEFLVHNTASRLRSQAQAMVDRYTGGAFVSGMTAVPGVRVVSVEGDASALPADGTRAEVIHSIRDPSLMQMAANIVQELTSPGTSATVIDLAGEQVANAVGYAEGFKVPVESTGGARSPERPASIAARGSVAADRTSAPIVPPDPLRVRATAEMGVEQTYVTSMPESGGRQLVMLLPLRRVQDNAVIGVLQVATSLQPADDLLGRLRLLLMLGLGGALGVSVLLGVPLTRAALRPLDRLVETTERIATDDLSARSELPYGDDEIGRLAASFDQMLERIEAGVRNQRRFVADAAHELRTPLTAISGLIELLLLGADNEDRATRRRTLVTVDRDLTRLTRLVNDLLALSRHDLAVPHRRERVDLTALVTDLHSLTAELAPDRDVRVEAPAGSVQVIGDADHLRQVLLNLAENARRYTGAGERITFRLRRRRRVAEVAVIDSGSGIPAADLPRIFERFYRGDQARSRHSGGSGLGLAIAQAIARAHDGTLTAESTPGAGATFRFRLPLAQPAGERVEDAAPPASLHRNFRIAPR
ncbi:MAG: sensor histidine kinase [Dehalococcoidia bacterium]